MKQTLAVLPPHARTVCVYLTLCLLSLTGCSNGSASGSATASLDESEIAAIKSKAKSPQDFRKSLENKLLEKEGIVIPTKPAAKVTKKRR